MNNDMTQGKIFPVLMRFAIPIFIGDIFQQLYNVVDTIIVGRTLGADALGAVGATGTIMFLIIGFVSTMSAGFAVVTSQRFGAKDEEGVKYSFINSLILMVIIGLIMTLACMIFLNPLLKLMNTPADIFEDSYSYISVICEGMIATIFYNLFASNLRAIGNSRVPLYFLILASIINIVLDLVFIINFSMGVAGAAWATIASQFISALLCGIYIFTKEKDLMPKAYHFKLNKCIVKQQLSIAIPMGLQTAITASGTIIMQSAMNTFGSTAVSAITVANKCKNIFTQPFMSIGTAVATFCGQNYGAGDMKRVKKGVWTAFKIGTIYAIFSAIVVYILLPWEMKLFLSEKEVVSDLLVWADPYVLASAALFLPLVYIFVFRSAIQGIGRSVFAMLAGVVELISRIVIASISMKTANYNIAIWCDPGAWVTAALFVGISFVVISRKLTVAMEKNKEKSV